MVKNDAESAAFAVERLLRSAFIARHRSNARLQVETTAAKALRGCECFKSSSHCRDQSKKLKPAKVEAILLDLLGLLDYA